MFRWVYFGWGVVRGGGWQVDVIDNLLVMVRLEKVIYEKAVNGLNRARAIGAPRKWYHANPYEHLRRIASPTQSTTSTSWTELSSENCGSPSPNGSPSSKCASTSISSGSRDSPPRTASSISTRPSGEMSSSSTWPARRTFKMTQPPPLPLGAQGAQKRKVLQDWLRGSWVLRPRARGRRDSAADLCGFPASAVRVGEPPA